MLPAIQALVASLSHQIRTPLSIISNDLAYWSHSLPEGETDRAAQQIKTVSDILGNLQSLCRLVDNAQVVPLSGIGDFSFSAHLRVRVAPGAMRKTLEILASFLVCSSSEGAGWRITDLESFVSLSIGREATTSLLPPASLVNAVARTFGEQRVPAAVFAEAVVRDAGGSIRFSEDFGSLCVSLPRVTGEG